MFIMKNQQEVAIFLEQFSWILNQALLIQYVQTHMVNFLNQKTLFSDKVGQETIELKDIILMEQNS